MQQFKAQKQFRFRVVKRRPGGSRQYRGRLCEKCRVALPGARLQVVLRASPQPAELLFLIKSLFGGNSISFLFVFELDKFYFLPFPPISLLPKTPCVFHSISQRIWLNARGRMRLGNGQFKEFLTVSNTDFDYSQHNYKKSIPTQEILMSRIPPNRPSLHSYLWPRIPSSIKTTEFSPKKP